MKNNKPAGVILILGLLAAVCLFSIDMYLPGFPAIASDLHTLLYTGADNLVTKSRANTVRS